MDAIVPMKSEIAPTRVSRSDIFSTSAEDSADASSMRFPRRERDSAVPTSSFSAEPAFSALSRLSEAPERDVCAMFSESLDTFPARDATVPVISVILETDAATSSMAATVSSESVVNCIGIRNFEVCCVRYRFSVQ